MKGKDEIKGLTTCKTHKKNLINKSAKTLTNFLHISIWREREKEFCNCKVRSCNWSCLSSSFSFQPELCLPLVLLVFYLAVFVSISLPPSVFVNCFLLPRDIRYPGNLQQYLYLQLQLYLYLYMYLVCIYISLFCCICIKRLSKRCRHLNY